MLEYICTKCKKICYSSASPEYQRNDNCPYEGCDGKVVLKKEGEGDGKEKAGSLLVEE